MGALSSKATRADRGSPPASQAKQDHANSDWQRDPLQTIKETARLIKSSQSQVYALLHAGELKAVRLGGRTLVKTESISAFHTSAEPWSPNKARVARAVAARSDVVAKAAAKQATTRKTRAS
jgi:excisionase family DNA binding protein